MPGFDERDDGEEFLCAHVLDSLEAVEFWARNVAGYRNAFWLRTASGRTYPDWIAKLAGDH